MKDLAGVFFPSVCSRSGAKSWKASEYCTLETFKGSDASIESGCLGRESSNGPSLRDRDLRQVPGGSIAATEKVSVANIVSVESADPLSRLMWSRLIAAESVAARSPPGIAWAA